MGVGITSRYGAQHYQSFPVVVDPASEGLPWFYHREQEIRRDARLLITSRIFPSAPGSYYSDEVRQSILVCPNTLRTFLKRDGRKDLSYNVRRMRGPACLTRPG